MTVVVRSRLAVDLGASTTVAMVEWPDGRIRPLLFDGSPLLSSAVFFAGDGRLHVGHDAIHLARNSPERLEPNPKRRVDDDRVLLGGTEVPVRDLLTAVLHRVVVEAGRVTGPVTDVTLTYPAAWGSRRCALLTDAAHYAGLPTPRLVTEPVAAAAYFARTMHLTVPVGGGILVYDLGAGTCDVTLLRRTGHGFDVVASDGLNDVGGLDVDAAIVAFLEASYGTPWTDRVSRRRFWDEVRTAKEMLSRTSGTLITIPALGKEVPLGREQFDGLVTPVLRPTIALTKSLLRDAAAAAPTSLLLVGGASRIPLVATLLYDAIGVAPTVIEQPELVVAEGALHATAEQPALTTPTNHRAESEWGCTTGGSVTRADLGGIRARRIMFVSLLALTIILPILWIFFASVGSQEHGEEDEIEKTLQGAARPSTWPRAETVAPIPSNHGG